MYTTIYMKMSDNEVIIIKLWTFDSHTLPYWYHLPLTPVVEVHSFPSPPTKSLWPFTAIHSDLNPLTVEPGPSFSLTHGTKSVHGFQTLKKWREINAAIFTHTRTLSTHILSWMGHTHTWYCCLVCSCDWRLTCQRREEEPSIRIDCF